MAVSGRLDCGGNNRIRDDARNATDKDCAIQRLHQAIIQKDVQLDEIFWETILLYQNAPFYTMSGLEFSYAVKRKKNGDYGGELLVSRKEDSKTLTKSSILLAFHKILESCEVLEAEEGRMLHPAEYKGPKKIGQIFGISYLYSLFWQLGLIRVPEQVAEKMNRNK